jgi:hypothetical protein
MCDNIKLAKRHVDLNDKIKPSDHVHTLRCLDAIKSVGKKIGVRRKTHGNSVEERCLACYVRAS